MFWPSFSLIFCWEASETVWTSSCQFHCPKGWEKSRPIYLRSAGCLWTLEIGCFVLQESLNRLVWESLVAWHGILPVLQHDIQHGVLRSCCPADRGTTGYLQRCTLELSLWPRGDVWPLSAIRRMLVTLGNNRCSYTRLQRCSTIEAMGPGTLGASYNNGAPSGRAMGRSGGLRWSVPVV